MEIVKKQMTLHHTVSVIGGFMAGYTIINHSDILANAQTGNLIRLVLSAFEGNLLSIGYIVLLFLTYAASCVFYTVFRRYSPLSMKIVSLIVTALAICATGILSLTGNSYLSVVPIAFAMPVQWNAYKKAGGNSSATIFSSNNVRQAVMLSTTYVMDRDKKALRNAKFYWATLLCFHTGVAAACLLSIFFAAQSIWFCFVLIGISVIAYYRYESAKIKAFSDI